MTERIDKLLVKAGAYFGGEGVDYSNFDPKKFAELIVQECADWLKQPVNQTPSCGTVMNITAERLKEHFGVEE